MVCGSSSGEIDISDVFVGQSKENLDSVDNLECSIYIVDDLIIMT